MKYLALAFVGVSSLLANSAQAEEWYAGGALLSIETDSGISPVSGTATIDEKDSGFKVFIGRKIDENLSIEGFYVDYGEVRFTGNSGDLVSEDGVLYVLTADNVVIKSDTSGIGVSVRYDIPVSSVFDIYAKLGLLRWDFEQTSTATGVASQTVSESGTDTIFGIGVNFAASDQFSIFVDYEMTEVDNDDTTVLGAGVAVNF